MKFIIKNLSAYTLVVLFILVLVLVPVPFEYSKLNAQVENLCEKRLNDADSLYNFGHFDAATTNIEDCLSDPNIAEAEKVRAYHLLGLVYIGRDLEKEAKDAVRELLFMVPSYKPDPDFDPIELDTIINNILQELKPIISSIAPDDATVGDPGFTITVNGTDFVRGSVVRFNKSERATTHISSTQLTAEILSTDLLKEVEYEVTVFSPILGGRVSNTEKFTVEEGNPLIWVLIGGAVVAVVAAILVFSGEDDVDPGEFPGPPGRQ